MTNDDTERKRRQLEEEIGLYEKILNAHRKRHEQMNNDSDNVIQVSLADEYECIPDSQPSHDPSPSRVDESAKMSTLRHDDDGGDIAKDDICDNVNHITDYTRHARDVPNLSRGYPLTCRDVKLKFHRRKPWLLVHNANACAVCEVNANPGSLALQQMCVCVIDKEGPCRCDVSRRHGDGCLDVPQCDGPDTLYEMMVVDDIVVIVSFNGNGMTALAPLSDPNHCAFLNNTLLGLSTGAQCVTDGESGIILHDKHLCIRIVLEYSSNNLVFRTIYKTTVDYELQRVIFGSTLCPHACQCRLSSCIFMACHDRLRLLNVDGSVLNVIEWVGPVRSHDITPITPLSCLCAGQQYVHSVFMLLHHSSTESSIMSCTPVVGRDGDVSFRMYGPLKQYSGRVVSYVDGHVYVSRDGTVVCETLDGVYVKQCGSHVDVHAELCLLVDLSDGMVVVTLGRD